MVFTLMGGALERTWDEYPEYDSVLIGTQDQLLSRALNRGYGVGRARWPVDFAFLNNDVLWVFDEVQLMGGGGLFTSAQMQAFRETFGSYGPARSIWMSATLAPEWLKTVDFANQVNGARVLTLDETDLGHPVVRQRLAARKPLVRTGLHLTKRDVKQPERYAAQVADLVQENHRPGTVTLVIVNRVNRAQAVWSALKKRGVSDRLLLLHSRFRPVERERLRARLQEWQQGDAVVVATQAVEAGVDLSARTLITETAPWASMVQRFGRCNRYGEAPPEGPDAARVLIIDVEEDEDAALPYRPEELAQTAAILEGLVDVGVAGLPEVPLPPPRGAVIRKKDILDLFDTTPDLTGLDVDISPYVREVTDTDVQVFWRAIPEGRPEREPPRPRPDEICPVSLAQIREYLAQKQRERRRRAWMWDGFIEDWVVVDGQNRHPVPGQLLLLDAQDGGYDPDLGFVPTLWDPVPPVTDRETDVEDESDRYDGDPRSFLGSGRFVELTEHLRDVREETLVLVRRLGVPCPAEALAEAAAWHDVGKAHPVMRARLTSGLPEGDPRREQLWAKSGTPRRTEGDRKHFRHELASALAYLGVRREVGENGLTDLVAYLIAAHHGKVRVSIRSLPNETDPGDGRLFARGIWQGDELPAVVLGDGTTMPPQVLDLTWMLLGGREEASWLERVMRLLEQYGPFRLAFLEAVLRVADWRASEKEAVEPWTIE
ncbi:MAG: CRISPR-associated helicase Cas3' [Alicyclobacillaceae bacterium]|nr:CRISPR-associated helicase Cas3' [Alicyclobacillaceae bacterium]